MNQASIERAKQMEAVLKRLIQARKNAGLSQAQVAQLLGFSHQSGFSPYEVGRHELTLSMMLRLCDIYVVSPIWMLTGANPYFDDQQFQDMVSRIRLAAEDAQKLRDLLLSLPHDNGLSR